MKQKKHKRVVIALDLAKPDGRRKLSGILSCLSNKHIHWDLRIKRGRDEFTESGVADFPNWGIDGIIYSLPATTPEAAASADTLAKLDIPLVVIDPGDHPAFAERKKKIAVIKTDTQSVGEIAANHFFSQGSCLSYAYIPDLLERDWSKKRGESFAKALRLRGAKCHFFSGTKGVDDFTALRKFLSSLPMPAGILVAYDSRAMTVAEACAAEGIPIPRAISLLSVDDDEFLCENCTPTLSSILPAHELSGTEAVLALRDLMAGKELQRQTVKLPVETIVQRASTMAGTPSGHLVQKALAYIATHAVRGATVSDVVRHIKVSRTLADLRFREVLGVSIGRSLETARLKTVVRALNEGSMTIKEIADSCGYRDQFHLMRVFKRHFGKTMGEYRAMRSLAPGALSSTDASSALGNYVSADIIPGNVARGFKHIKNRINAKAQRYND